MKKISLLIMTGKTIFNWKKVRNNLSDHPRAVFPGNLYYALHTVSPLLKVLNPGTKRKTRRQCRETSAINLFVLSTSESTGESLITAGKSETCYLKTNSARAFLASTFFANEGATLLPDEKELFFIQYLLYQIRFLKPCLPS